MWTYPETHPWITFSLDTTFLDYKTWLLLGRVQAKCKFISNAPSSPDIAQALRHIFLTKSARATVAIEGNTLTEEEVSNIIKGEAELPPSQEYLGQQVENVVEAYNLIAKEVLSRKSQPFTVEKIKKYNALVLKDLQPNEGVIPGEIRDHSVVVTVAGYRGCHPQECEYLLKQLCDRILNAELGAPREYEVAFEIIRAIVAHVYFAWIHPFGDGNGRTARLIEFEILLRAGIPDIVTHLLSNHYNKTRDEYYRYLDRSSKVVGHPFEFVSYALQGLVDGLNEQMKLIQGYQLRIHWRNFIRKSFDEMPKSVIMDRRKLLLLELSDDDAPNNIQQIRNHSVPIGIKYANKSDKTVQRDINWLAEHDFIRIIDNKIMPNHDQIIAFLPKRVELG